MIVNVSYQCLACQQAFTVQQHDYTPDDEIDTCPDCLDIMFTSSAHGTFDDPWTAEKIREARRRRDEAPLRVRRDA